uniref:Uncharacterized protein n=1 Tax=Dulem virus 42 TaxID=3145760 RepID=A0AAU8BAW8_9CAUD
MEFNTKNKPFLYPNGDINAWYGPWDSISQFITAVTDDIGTDSIPLCTTIAVKSGNNVYEYWNPTSTAISTSSFVKKVTESSTGTSDVSVVNVEDYLIEGKSMPTADIYLLDGLPAIIRETAYSGSRDDYDLYIVSGLYDEASYRPNRAYRFYGNAGNTWLWDGNTYGVTDFPYFKFFFDDISNNNITFTPTSTNATLKIADNGGNAAKSISTTIPAATGTTAGLMTASMYNKLSALESGSGSSSANITVADTTYSTSLELDAEYPDAPAGSMVVYPGTTAGGDAYVYLKVQDSLWIVLNGSQVGTAAAATARIIGASVLSYK